MSVGYCYLESLRDASSAPSLSHEVVVSNKTLYASITHRNNRINPITCPGL